MTESVGNNEIWQICNLPSKVHFCNSINITGITKNVFNVVSSKKNPVRTKYETKNTSTFQLFHCQQTQSLLITLYFKIGWKFWPRALSCTILLNARPLTNRKPSPENHVKITPVYYFSESTRQL
jgi:hypothetical protein